MIKKLIWFLLITATPLMAEESVDLEPEDLPASAEAVVNDPALRHGEESKAATSEPIFDWSEHQNERKVKHPFAPKGLSTINAQREYFYKVDESPQKHSASFRVGLFNPIKLENPDKVGEPNSTFEENYDQTRNPTLLFDYQMRQWLIGIGRIGLMAGGGLYIAQGNGHFETRNQNLTPREIITFWAIPANVGAKYSMQFWHRQMLVPYGEGGITLIPFGELRDDGKPPKWGGAAAAYFAGGLGLELTYFDMLSRINLDREYGINRVYFLMEYRGLVGLTRYDFSGDLINAGISAYF